MKHLILIIMAGLACFVGGLRRQFATANVEGSAGTHKTLTLLADAAHGSTHLLIKAGSDANHGAVCGAANYPIGITTDAPEAAEDPFNVKPLGIEECTRKARCATALGADIDLYTAANGLVQAEPGVVGSYYKVGRSVAAAAQVGTNDYLIEFAPQAPERLAVLANGAVIGDYNTALATPALIKVL